MKKTILLFLFLGFVYLNLQSQCCLPEGITFTTQAQVDNFQVNYPACTKIEGSVYIVGNYITDLSGLSVLDSICGSLVINETWELTSLSGLDNLTSIGGSLMIGDWWSGNEVLSNLDGLTGLATVGQGLFIGFNHDLSSLNGLSNLVSISGELLIMHNATLTSLSGLQNIIGSTITRIGIYNNPVLTECNIEGLCEYLADIQNMISIYNNGPGCDNAHEIADSCGFQISCLPYGNYYFVSQANIDSFPSYYPDCNRLNGYTWIEGDNITHIDSLYGIDTIGGPLFICGNPLLAGLSGLDNLRTVTESFYLGYWEHGSNPLLRDMTGLGKLKYVGGEMMFLGNASLQNFTGLDSLEEIGLWFSIGQNHSLKSFEGLNSLHSVAEIGISGNDSLSSLNGLQSLVNITFTLGVQNNPMLVSLDGIENINADSMLFLRISDNGSLSECNVQSVCDFLGIPDANVIIENNATGCKTPEEVLEACSVGIEESAACPEGEARRIGGQRSAVVCYPNPANAFVYFDFNLQTQSEVNLSVFNNMGQMVATIQNGSLEKGDHQLIWNAGGFSAGIYFYRFSQGDYSSTGKLVKTD